LCRVLGVSRSGFYAWQRRPLPRRDTLDESLVERIREVHTRSRGTYGSPRVHRALRSRGVVCGKNRIARLMQRESIVAACEQRFTNTSTFSRELAAAPNLLQRRFRATAPNQVWVTDMTFLSTRQGWIHLCAVLDLFSRRCVGWAVGARANYQLACRALKNALEQRRPERGLMLHSDQGGAFLSYAYQELLDEHGMVMSTSRSGNCLDNAVAESFFKTLKTEMYYRESFTTQEDARRALFDYIESFYNSTRLHSTLDYRSPAEYEANAA
jgi:transposase InsO family protein